MIARNNQVDKPRVTPVTPRSYHAADVATLTTALLHQAYRQLEVRSPHEHARLQKLRSLIVIYQSGSVVVQGADMDAGHAAIATVNGGGQ
jgi:ribonuclease HIII